MGSQFLRLRLNPLPQFLINLSEHVIGPIPDGLLGPRKMPSHVTNKIILLARLLAQNLPQRSRLHIIFLRDRNLLRHRRASPFFMFLRRLDGLVGHIAVGRRVVGIGAIIAIDCHDAVALIRIESAEGLVDRDLLVVDAEAMAVGVGVGKQTGLEDWVGRGFNTRDHVRGGEGDLFDLGKVVLAVAIEGESAEAPERDLFLWPHFREVEDVPAEFLGLLGGKHLQIAGPAGVLAVLYGVEEVLSVPIGILRSHVASLSIGESLAAQISFAVDLYVIEGAIRLRELIGVA